MKNNFLFIVEDSVVGVRIINTNGQVIENKICAYIPSGAQQIRMDLQDLPGGMYIVELRTKQRVKTEKLMIIGSRN